MKKTWKKLASLLVAAALFAGLTVSASAADKTVKQVGAGYLTGMCLTEDGTLYGFGTSSLGELGPNPPLVSGPNGNTVPKPAEVTDGVESFDMSSTMSSQNSGSVHTSGGHTLILKTNGKLYALGDNSCGQLGLGDRAAHPGLQYMMNRVKAYSAGASSSAVVTEDGKLWYCGLIMQQNSGKAQYYFTPEFKCLLEGVADVAMGEQHIVALKEDGSVWTMGNAYAGCLGNGMTSGFTTEFTKVFDGAVDVSAGSCHTLALTADGTMYGWGDNGSGQLGQGWKVHECLAPVAILKNVKSIECGYRTSHAIKTDNSLWSMGWNYRGQLGIGKETHDGVPYCTMKDVKQVSGGYQFTLTLKQDGSMYGTGTNYYSQFGNGEIHYQVLSYVPAGLTACPIVIPGENPFTDVNTSLYCYDPVLWALEQNITTGTTPTTFAPNNPCTRAQIITFLWRAAGRPMPIGLDEHDDVHAKDWFIDPVRWATAEGMIHPTNNFLPYNTCTRAMAMEFMWKYAGSPDCGLPAFKDVPANASYAKAVAWAVQEGITTGTTATTFSPNNPCTRGQIATFLYRAFA